MYEIYLTHFIITRLTILSLLCFGQCNMSFTHHQVPYQNQLQFNLGVPLTTKNLAAQHQHPRPILVERVGGQHAIPSKLSPRKAGENIKKNKNSNIFFIMF